MQIHEAIDFSEKVFHDITEDYAEPGETVEEGDNKGATPEGDLVDCTL